ncbi:RICIN domain-containing protein [Actinomadura litoris]|uniref:RICIN domain-containing protein n=1 Tax=Actinomadura litoris TaxID=2678616 RepID=UPI001FA7B09A|nr:ricin-type beta-trefoil lectin domain protein [Actinomadura litoris]
MRGSSMFALLPVVVMAGGLWAGSSASAAPSPRPESQRELDGVLIKPVAGNGLCLEVADDNSGNGALVTLYTCTGRDNQRWTFEGGMIRTGLPGHRCLDVRTGNGRNGAATNIYDCNSTRGQQWHFVGDKLASGINGTCLTVVAGNFAPGGGVLNWECVVSQDQAWEVS